MTTLVAPEFGTHVTMAAGPDGGDAAGDGVWMLWTGEAVGLGLAAAVPDALGDCERAARDPGEAPTPQALTSTINRTRPASRPILQS
jgi:hypothetical protein